ncbi:MAG TPA: hypothetical protein VIM65_05650 [Cyclobacteriaceae bacterium]
MIQNAKQQQHDSNTNTVNPTVDFGQMVMKEVKNVLPALLKENQNEIAAK